MQHDNPELWEKIKGHEVDMPDDWEGEHPIFCKKCGKIAIQSNNLLWICPDLFEIANEYFSP